MRALIVKERFLRGERGFTLVEMLVTLVIWIMVLFALYGIFDMSVRVFSFGNNKVEAADSARAGLDKMVQEIRQAYPYNPGAATPDTHLFDIWNPTEIRFGNDLDGNGVIQCPNTGTPPQCDKIGYVVYDAGSGHYALGRDNTSTGTTNTVANLQPVVDHVDYVSPTDTGLSFTYCKSGDTVSGDNCPAGFDVATTEADIVLVRIQLRIRVHKGLKDATQTLTTDVGLRSRGG
jgi:competence protein ComGC